MAGLGAQQPDYETGLYSISNYGVYVRSLTEHPTTSQQLIATATDWNTAYNTMRTHARLEIDKNVNWGSTYEIVTNGVFQIIDSNHVPRLCFEIDSIRPAGKDATGAIIWEREKDRLSQKHDEDSPIHYRIYVDLNCDRETQKQRVLIGGYTSLEEVNHAMKTSAHAFMKEHSGVKIIARSVELVGEKGEVRQRYVVEKGRWKDAAFVKEDDWIQQEMAIRDRTLYSSPPNLSMGNNAGRPFFRITLPESSSTLPHSEPAVAAQPLHPPAAPATHTQRVGITKENPKLWCICNRPDDGLLMLGCENKHCPIHWYHARCVGVTEAPRKQVKWWCPQCAPGQEREIQRRAMGEAKQRERKKRRHR